MSTITKIEIDCNAGKNEIVTTIHHLPETSRVNERECELGMVTISERRFTAYAACPVSTARKLASDARAMLPSVPVSLYNA